MQKTWLITGATSGLGLIMAERLLVRGDRIVALVRRPAALNALSKEYDQQLFVLPLDLSRLEEIRPAVDKAFALAGRIDVIVSNAAYGLFGAAEEVSEDQIHQQIATNLTGSILLIRSALPHLRAQGSGRILQISSEGGQITYPSFGLYHATKWGIEGFVETVAQEIAPFGIDCIIAEPGPTGTNFGANLAIAGTIPAYATTPAGQVRKAISDGSFVIRGDAERTVTAMIAAIDSPTPPLRLALGSTAYKSIHSALTNRLRLLEAQKEVAFSADRPDTAA
ncbi:SDR family oxidoreductase [Radicibacter daui]|uniref:SDR family oxidoreductase n=1 Tax=Radicibacter daui TaxID=3064829 RepID=UPI004046F945